MDDWPGELRRAVKQDDQPSLFDFGSPWEDHWWGMPAFAMGDAKPFRRLVVSFPDPEAVRDFAKRLGLRVSEQSDSCWYPQQDSLTPGKWYWDGPKTDSIYPVCIPSNGRAAYQITAKVLDRLGISYRVFVEETEAEAYAATVGEQRIVVMPFHDLGQGSIPARNFIWEWAREREYKRHWTVDDNIRRFSRLHNNRRLGVRGGAFFQAMESFVDRYENVAMAGPHHEGFVKDRGSVRNPVLWNSRIYSCILLDTSLGLRWRGRYNEDTDLSLRLLKKGYTTLLFNALLMSKCSTVGCRNSKPIPGGNTDNVYNAGDHRRAFAESLREQHPDCVKVVWKFNRWHHLVNYSAFAKNRPVLKQGITPTRATDEWGMRLVCRDDRDDIFASPQDEE